MRCPPQIPVHFSGLRRNFCLKGGGQLNHQPSVWSSLSLSLPDGSVLARFPEQPKGHLGHAYASSPSKGENDKNGFDSVNNLNGSVIRDAPKFEEF